MYVGPKSTYEILQLQHAFKSTYRQPVQSDVGDFDHLQMPFAYAVNVNLVSRSPQNGATEIWLGSHRDTNSSMTDPKDGGVLKHLVEDRRKFSPPLQPSVPKGAIIIRDFSIWHAGMPNHTDDPRLMLISTHFAAWYRSDFNFFFPNSLKGKINWGRLVPCVNWVDDD
jgi:ectoine hydroxylase-related dioxygenase (phytanoyl-CoA dioxygenase family)